MVSWLHIGELAGKDGGAASLIHSGHGKSLQGCALASCYGEAVSCKGEHTAGGMYSDVNDWDQGLGLNWRIKLSNKRLSLFHLESLYRQLHSRCVLQF